MINTLTGIPYNNADLKTTLIMFYKKVHHIDAVPLELPFTTDNRTRKIHLQTYRHTLTSKDCYKYYFFYNGFTSPKLGTTVLYNIEQ